MKKLLLKSAIGLSVAFLMSGCATKSDTIGLFSEDSEIEHSTQSIISLTSDEIPLCENGTAVLTKSSKYIRHGYFPTSISKDENATTNIIYDALKKGYSSEIIGCWMDDKKNQLSLKMIYTKTDIKMNGLLHEMNLDNAVKRYQIKD